MWLWWGGGPSNCVPSRWNVVPPEKSNFIEEEYQKELSGERSGQRVYHCFGSGGSTCINFKQMQTYCSSAKCLLTHDENYISRDHLSFSLFRDM